MNMLIFSIGLIVGYFACKYQARVTAFFIKAIEPFHNGYEPRDEELVRKIKSEKEEQRRRQQAYGEAVRARLGVRNK
jgi:hypothetical protein